MSIAHLLIPQIMRRAEEVSTALGDKATRAAYLPPPQARQGDTYPMQRQMMDSGMDPDQAADMAQKYTMRQTPIGHEKTPYDPRGLMNKPEATLVDPRFPGGATVMMLGALQRSGDPRLQNVARAFQAGMEGRIGTQGGTRPGYLPPTLIPNAPSPSQRPSGQPLKLEKGEAVAFNEKGESLDRRGKKLGYLKDPNIRTLDRRDTDIIVGPHGTPPGDAFGAESLRKHFEKHVKAWEDNFQDTGKEGFPEGYFKGMTRAQQENIREGVRALRALDRNPDA